MNLFLNPFLQKGENHVQQVNFWTGKSQKESLLARTLPQVLMKVNLIATLVGLSLTQVDASTFAQQITLKKQKTTLESVLKTIEKQSGFTFFYQKGDITTVRDLDVDFKNVPLEQALVSVLHSKNLVFEYFDKTIVIKKSNSKKNLQTNTTNVVETKPSASTLQLQQMVRGKIINQEGIPIKGASIRLKNDPSKVVMSQDDGSFSLPITSLNEILVISYVGYQTVEVKAILVPSNMIIKMKLDDQEMDEVVITGIVQRKKESFTGATSTFSGEDLKQVSNQNVIAALRSLDPSFVQIENNAMGSNPNALPKIELRGQTSISNNNLRDEFSTDPNQPLFILDGFETNLRTIVDLDMNIIQSVTILKDAASTAIYGSRASNGVVVIETIKPKAGSVKVTYSSDVQIQTPDLRSYNMMDASEKLLFEKLSGRYKSSNIIQQQLKLDELYDERLARVLRGVNTYWLDKPLQTGFGQRHSLSARGGEGAVVFDVGVNYRNTKGTMIGSERRDYGGNLNINYRKGKLNIGNRAFITGFENENSPYGSFATWVNTNPYFEPLPFTEKYLDFKRAATNEIDLSVANPFYNASLNSFNRSKNYTINNNIQLTYDFNTIWRLTATGQISKGNTNDNIFFSPLHTRFDNTVNTEKGSLEHGELNNFSYTGNIMLTYAKLWDDKHSITSNVRAEISENQYKYNGYTAIGFPSTSNGNPAFSNGFAKDSRPRTIQSLSRRTSMLASFNYSYDQRYNADFNYNLDGSTSFGSAHQFAPYYSFGASWNLHKEQFMAGPSWFDILRLRANIGVTGNQNFGNISQSVFSYLSDINRFGQGTILESLGAPDLRWQKTRQTSVGLDAVMFDNKLNIQLNAYDKLTDPLVVAVTLPSSTGLENYPFNAGNLDNKGVEAIINYSPIYRPSDRFVLTFGIMGSMLKSRYDNFNNRLNALNTEMANSNSLIRYQDGYSPNDLWAVRSAGIDPGTGQEVYIKKNGQRTFNYDPADIVRVGNSHPIAEGVLRGSLSYKGFTANVMVRYVFGKYDFNNALYGKVENISLNNVENNQDRRALYDRWQQPGDITSFKGISLTNQSPISSRFVQRENSFSGESLGLGYDFSNKKWMDQVRLSNIRINAILNDLFYSSTIRRERGIDYPFARTVAMSLFVTFK